MPQISDETKLQVLAATDIVDLIGSYIEVKRSGSGNFVALCPFHNEKSPSFNISSSRQFFHCFGCKKSGDAITFVRDYENLPFPDALKKLASRAGIAVEEQVFDPQEDRARRHRGRLLDIHREATAFMHRQLMRAKEPAQHARDYLKSRGFGAEMAARWMIGWCPDNPRVFRSWAEEKGYSQEDLVDAGIVGVNERGAFLRFTDRLMIPIRDPQGEVVAFSGRQLRESKKSGKYVNSPETALFKKSNILFALDRARSAMLKEGATIICEGQIDAISCHEHGVVNAIASQGTAFTAQHAQLLRRYTRQVILCFDADFAGFEAATKTFRILAPENIGVRMIRMPAGEDPDSFLRKNGADAFRELVAGAPDYFDAIMDRAQESGQMDTPESRAALQNDYATQLALVADPSMRDALLNKVSTRLRSGTTELRDAISRSAKKAAAKATLPSRRSSGFIAEESAPEPAIPAAIDTTVAYLCSLALRSIAAQEWLGEQFETLHEAGEYLEGVPILEAILSARPDAASPAAVNLFLAGLPESQRLALYADATFQNSLPDEVLHVAQETIAELSAKHLMKRDARNRADLTRPNLTVEERDRLMGEAIEIGALLAGLKNRFASDDRYAPSTRKSKGPENSKFPYGKRERKP